MSHRTRKQYNAFRRAFSKWCKKNNFTPYIGAKFLITSYGGCEVYFDGTLSEYIAPDYTNYMRYEMKRKGLKEVKK